MNYRLVRDEAGFYSQVPVQEEPVPEPIPEPVKVKLAAKKDK